MNSEKTKELFQEEAKEQTLYQLCKNGGANHYSQYVTVDHPIQQNQKIIQSRNYNSIHNIPSPEGYQNLQAARKSVSLHRKMNGSGSISRS